MVINMDNPETVNMLASLFCQVLRVKFFEFKIRSRGLYRSFQLIYVMIQHDKQCSTIFNLRRQPFVTPKHLLTA